MEQIINFFDIASLNHDRYPGVRGRYISGDLSLVKCNLLGIRRFLLSKETRKQFLGLPPPIPSVTENQVSNAPYLSLPTANPTFYQNFHNSLLTNRIPNTKEVTL